MTKPSIGDLLNGVATSLRESVLPEIPAGPTRRQVQAAVSIVRRVALVWENVGSYLYADNKDIEETLRQVAAILERTESDGSGSDLKLLRQRLSAALEQYKDAVAEYPSPAALGVRNVELQGLLIELQDALPALSATERNAQTGSPVGAERFEIAAMLRALFRRMLERELRVTAPPSARK